MLNDAPIAHVEVDLYLHVRVLISIILGLSVTRLEYLRSLGPEYLWQTGAFLILCAVAARTRNPIFHGLFAVVGLIYQAAFICRYFFSLA